MRIALILLSCTFLAACRGTPEKASLASSAPDGPTSIVAGRSVGDRPIEILVLGEPASGDSRNVTLIIASIHGNEAVGTPLARRLAAHLASNPDFLRGRQVIVMPEANPDGVAAHRRTNANHVDLNRNFDTANRRADRRSGVAGLSEPESRAIDSVIDTYRPTRIVSIHQPLSCIDFDGPGERLAHRMSLACGLPVKKLGALPGSLGSHAGVTLGIPIITLELPGGAGSLDEAELWKRYGPALLEAVAFDAASR